MSFWENLPKPIFALAPMEDVTDYAFREMFAKYSGSNFQSLSLRGNASDRSNPSPDKIASSSRQVGTPRNDMNGFVMFTEFINVDGLLHPEGFKKLSIDLKFSPIQRPIVAQIWGRDPEKFARVAEMLAGLGFDGIDINFGCPQSKEIQAGTCAALIREPKLAQEIIRSTKKNAGSLPVSVKTRLGYSKTEEMENWLLYVLETQPAAVTLHARTKQEMSKVPAHWDKIAEAVEIRNREKCEALIIGNGDVKSVEDGLEKINQTHADGAMIGRAAFGNPWTFKDVGSCLGMTPLADAPRRVPTSQERLRVMLEHATLFDQTFAGVKSFVIMRKHFKAYCSGFGGAAELRQKLMEAKNLGETREIVGQYLKILA